MKGMTREGKQAELKRIIGELHAGTPVAEVRRDFERIVAEADAEEIAAMEQALVREGMPPEEIARLCEAHVAVFEGSLSRGKKPSEMPGHPVRTYMEENRAARAAFRALRRAAFGLALPWRDDASREAFDAALADSRKIVVHYARKENQLFPYLEAAGFDAPSKVMWAKHDEIRGLFAEAARAREAGDDGAARAAARTAAAKGSRMIFMEERILFPTALRKLSETDWAAIRRGDDAIGYAWTSPGSAWDPGIAAARASGPGGAAAADIRLGEGRLTPEQIDLMLKALPVDVSFVDQDDIVRYYSDGRERVFPRSPAVIGRNVENCHPPKSVAIVKRILEAFRAKERTEAEFWIKMGPRFIHIRYFPVYAQDGTYRGTVEVSQDATGIRALEGERRLLDWD